MLPSARALLALIVLAVAAAAQNRPDPVLEVADWHGRAVVAGELLVQFRPGAGAPQQALRHAQLGTTPVQQLRAGLARVALPAGAALDTFLAQYTALPDVRFAQPNLLHRALGTPDDPQWSWQWGLQKVHADLAWDAFAGDPATVVAVIDSGVDTDHPDLAAHLAWGSDPFAGDDDPEDADGHGTHCAGIASALTGNGLGVAGATPEGRFAAYRCGNTTFPTSALVPAIDDAVAQGACVLSMSWGSSFDDPAIHDALQAAFDQGCLLVAAAGNDASTAPFYPAAHDFVMAVAASTTTDERASFSNYGDWVDLAAPGQTIDSTWKGNSYKYLSGTSMACPLVAGAGALLYGRLGTRTPANAALVRAALESSAVPVGDWVAHGRLDMQAAMAQLFPDAPPVIDSVSPAAVPALHGTPVTLLGSGLSAATSLVVDGQPVDFAIGSDAELTFEAPDAAALGPSTLTVSGAAGPGSGVFTRIETDPPGLIVPAVVAAGADCTWECGGGGADRWYLLLALEADTFVISGLVLLDPAVVLRGGVLDEVGLGSLTVSLPADAGGITFRSQVVTWDHGFAGASEVRVTLID